MMQRRGYMLFSSLCLVVALHVHGFTLPVMLRESITLRPSHYASGYASAFPSLYASGYGSVFPTLQAAGYVQGVAPGLAQPPDDTAMRPLFNGRDLSGWVLVNTPPDTWKVEEGMLICSGKPTGEIRTDRMYQNFVLEVEWRHMVPGGNAGIFVWADDITARGVPFHRSVEVQVLENAYGQSKSHTTHGDIFPIHGAKMTPINGRGGDRAFPTQELSKPSPEWNHYRITCQDAKISLEVNGTLVTQGHSASPSKGYICLESEGGVVHYRNLKIREFPDSPVDEKDIATAHRGFRSLYSGLDLRNWKASESTAKHWIPSDWVLRYDGNSDALPLETEENFRHVEWILDVEFLTGDSQLGIDVSGLQLELTPTRAGIAPGWNRIMGTTKLGVTQLSINQQTTELTHPPSKLPHPIRLRPKGKLQVANLYVRTID